MAQQGLIPHLSRVRDLWSESVKEREWIRALDVEDGSLVRAIQEYVQSSLECTDGPEVVGFDTWDAVFCACTMVLVILKSTDHDPVGYCLTWESIGNRRDTMSLIEDMILWVRHTKIDD